MAPGASRGKSIALLALALSLACIALLVLFGRPTGQAPGPARSPREPEAPPVAAAAPEAEAAPSAPAREASARAAQPEGEPPGDPRVAAEAKAAPEAEGAPTLPSGIGLFPPAGSDPIKIGIVVPDDYDLPEGYLRHYQVTDDGQDLEPILLFHPDYELLDDAGQPIPLPEDRVVPPELAPPGLPIRMVEVPPPREETGP